MSSRAKNAALIVAVVLLALYGARSGFQLMFSPEGRAICNDWREDADRVLIHQGLVEETPGQWITGRWVGQVPFWRPLTSLVFWAEYRRFGWERQELWLAVHSLAHVVACVLLYMALRAVTGGAWPGLLAVAWANVEFVGMAHVHGIGAGLCCYEPAWKYQTDTWLAAATMWGLWAAWSKRPMLTVVACLVGCGFKETGFLISIGLLGVLLYRMRTVPWQAVGGAAMLVVLAAVKWHATGAGYVLGSNEHALFRALSFLIPMPIFLMSTSFGRYYVLAIAIIGPTLLYLHGKHRLAGVTLVVALAVAFGVSWYWLAPSTSVAIDAGINLVSLLEPTFLGTALIVVSWWGVGVHSVYHAPNTLRTAAIICVAMYYLSGIACTLAPQVMAHAYYTAMLFSACIVGIAAAAFAQQAWQWLRPRVPEPVLRHLSRGNRPMTPATD